MTETIVTDDELFAEVDEAMHDVIDPEIGINVVDLGLIYDMKLQREGDDTTVLIDMTLTSAECPLQDMITDQIHTALIGSGLVNDMKLNWVWIPAWGPDKITDDGREQLRALGFTV